jgi:hypothetical protein
MLLLAALTAADAQTLKVQQGLLLKAGTNIRLGSITILDKRSLTKTKSNTVGVFNIPALAGDTLEFNSDNFQ